MTIIRQIAQKIAQSPKISLFFHQLPDPDTLGSSLGLRALIRENFPEIDVREVAYDEIRGEQRIPYFRDVVVADETTVEWIQDSVGIILDTANTPRVFSPLFKECRELIRIDHHPKTETIGNLEWIDDRYSSTCEMVLQMARSLKWRTTPDALTCLYFGLLTDTNRFMYPSCTARTYELMAWMLKSGLDREFVHQNLYLREWSDAQIDQEIMKLVQIHPEGVASLFLDQSQNERFHQKVFSNKVNLMAGFKEIKIWTMVYWDDINKQWKGSIRSRDYIINDVAAQFGGGGHRLASGFKLTNPEVEYPKVIALLQEKIRNESQNHQ